MGRPTTGLGKQLNIVGDQRASLTIADDLAGAILAAPEEPQGESVPRVEEEVTPLSRYEFSVRLAGRRGLDTNTIH